MDCSDLLRFFKCIFSISVLLLFCLPPRQKANPFSCGFIMLSLPAAQETSTCYGVSLRPWLYGTTVLGALAKDGSSKDFHILFLLCCSLGSFLVMGPRCNLFYINANSLIMKKSVSLRLFDNV